MARAVHSLSFEPANFLPKINGGLREVAGFDSALDSLLFATK
jgi:hypothetical protein